jgi:magnesium chelatase subunit I
MGAPFPFSAIVGQDSLKLALLCVAVDPSIGGVLVFGDRGTGKSTAVRALAGVLPPIRTLPACAYHCDAGRRSDWCEDCRGRFARRRPAAIDTPVPVVELPLGATEDRVVGTLNLEQALTEGTRRFEPGLLARANRGFLYVDEVNLLEDHLVDLLIDVAASGENIVEREGLSVRHPARFVLVGSGNPEEGELRPQLLDRFGLSVDVTTPTDIEQRVEIVRRRDQFERDPDGFTAAWADQQHALRNSIVKARKRLGQIGTDDAMLRWASQLCVGAGTDGLRGELTLVRAARALAALNGRSEVAIGELVQMAPSALRHRLRRDPLDESGSAARIERAIKEQGVTHV